jgi:tetratricopeptide (TPR) repeat protein
MMLKRQDENGKPVLDYELGIGYNEVGNAYAMNGKYQVATEYFVKSIETFQALPNYEDTMLGWPESNIGLMYWMLGNHDDAERALTEIIEIYKTAYGVDDTQSFKYVSPRYADNNYAKDRTELAKCYTRLEMCTSLKVGSQKDSKCTQDASNSTVRRSAICIIALETLVTD